MSAADGVRDLVGYVLFFFFFNDPATTEIYTSIDTLSLHDALPNSSAPGVSRSCRYSPPSAAKVDRRTEKIGKHTSELQSPIDISYAVFCLKKKIASSAVDDVARAHDILNQDNITQSMQ